MGLLPRLKIAHKLPLIIVGSGLLVGLGIGSAGYVIGLRALESQRQESLEGSVQTGISEIQDYVKAIAADLRVFSARPETVDGLAAMSGAYAALVAEGKAGLLHEAYVTAAPNPAGQRQDTASSGAAPAYDTLHGQVHPAWRALLKERKFDDVLLLNADGVLIYSVQKNDDFGQSFTGAAAGDRATTGLGQVFTAAATLGAGGVAFADFTNYAPDKGKPKSFMGSPVYRGDTLVGVLAVAVPPQNFSARIASIKGLGRTGEALIIGSDGLMRSQSKYSMASDVLISSVKGDPTFDLALAGESVTGIVPSFRGVETAVMAVPTTVYGTTWIVAAVQNQSEVLAPVVAMRNLMAAVGAGLLVVAMVLGVLFSRSLSRPITRLTKAMDGLAGGDLTVAVEGARRHDEIGAMSRAVEVFRTNSARVLELNAEQIAVSDATRAERSAMMGELQGAFGAVVEAVIAGDFTRRVDAHFPDAELNELARSVNDLVETVDRGISETGVVLGAMADTDLTRRMQGDYDGAFAKLKTDVNAVADKLTEVVGQLRHTSGSLKTATGEILSGTNDLSERTTKQAATIEETSAAMDQLAATVVQNAQRARDASANATQVTRTAEEGGQVMDAANAAMERITQSSGQISKIIGMIDDIAFQTNLLALNASVEAARAGDAGKGFAVVAVEVRRLAQSAAQASSEIKVLIEQSAGEVKSGSMLVGDAAGKLKAMLEAVRGNNELLESIAKESREQASAIEDVSIAVRQMDEMTQHNAALVEETNAAIEQTEAQASQLDRIVDVFRIDQPSAHASERQPEAGLGLRPRLKAMAGRFSTQGNAAVAADWNEF